MCTYNLRRLGASLAFAGAASVLAAVASAQESEFDFGRTPTPETLSFDGWDIVVGPEGDNLPEGSGTVSEGKAVYSQTCLPCHGSKGTGGMGGALVGGFGTLDTDEPVKTVGSYWPYATTIFDYVHRAMPFNNPQSLSNDQVYAVTAYILYLNDIIKKDAMMNAKTLPEVEMPNRGGFIWSYPWPDVYGTSCQRDCQ